MTLATAARTRRNVAAPAAIPIARSGIVARDICRRGGRAAIAAVFERCFYLRCGDMFVCVAEPDIGNGPLTLIADTARSLHLRDLGLHAGQPAVIDDRGITIGNTVRLAIERGALWHPPPWPVVPPAEALINHSAGLARRAAVEAPAEGLAPIVFRTSEPIGGGKAFARAAATRVAWFERWLSDLLERDHAAAATLPEPVRGLIGLGPGLTPSGDDFLVGAVALLDALAQREPHDAMARALTAAPPVLTSALSRCFLLTAAAGHIGEKLHGIVSSVISGNVEEAIAASRAIGHSSGWDMLAGSASALRLVAVKPR
jgi:hypothetical protein